MTNTVHKHSFVQSQILTNAAVLGGNFLNIGFYALIAKISGQLMSEVIVLGAILSIFSLFAFTLRTYFIERITDGNSIRTSLHRLIPITLSTAIVCTILCCISSPFLAYFLQFTTPAPFFILAVSLPFLFIGQLFQATLLQEGRYLKGSFSILSESGLRLPVLALLVQYPLNATVGSMVLTLSSIAMFGITVFLAKENLRYQDWTVQWMQKKDCKELLILLLTTVSMGTIIKLDVLWAKHSLSAMESASYSLLSIIAYVLFAATSGVSRVAVSLARSNDYRKILGYSIFTILCICTISVIGYFAIGEWIVSKIVHDIALPEHLNLLVLFFGISCYSILSLALQCMSVLHLRVHALLAMLLLLLDCLLLMLFGTSSFSIALIHATVLTLGAMKGGALLMHVQRHRQKY